MPPFLSYAHLYVRSLVLGVDSKSSRFHIFDFLSASTVKIFIDIIIYVDMLTAI